MDKRVHKVSLALLVCKPQVDHQDPLVLLEILGWMVILDKKVIMGILAEQEAKVYQAVLDLQDPLADQGK